MPQLGFEPRTSQSWVYFATNRVMSCWQVHKKYVMLGRFSIFDDLFVCLFERLPFIHNTNWFLLINLQLQGVFPGFFISSEVNDIETSTVNYYLIYSLWGKSNLYKKCQANFVDILKTSYTILWRMIFVK